MAGRSTVMRKRTVRPAIVMEREEKSEAIPYTPEAYTQITDKDYYPLPGDENGKKSHGQVRDQARTGTGCAAQVRQSHGRQQNRVPPGRLNAHGGQNTHKAGAEMNEETEAVVLEALLELNESMKRVAASLELLAALIVKETDE